MASLALEFVSEAHRVGKAHISPRARWESPRREEDESRIRERRTPGGKIDLTYPRSPLREAAIGERIGYARATNYYFFCSLTFSLPLSLSLSFSSYFSAAFKIRASTHLDVSRARYRGRFAATDKRDRVARRCSDTLDDPDDRRDIHSTLIPCTY